MLAYAEVASAFQEMAGAPDISLLFPDTVQEVTTTMVFRSNVSYTGATHVAIPQMFPLHHRATPLRRPNPTRPDPPPRPRPAA